MLALYKHSGITREYDMADWNTAKAKAKEIRTKYSISVPPVNVFDIANSESIDIVYFTPNDTTRDISGLLDKENKRVYLNASDSAPRQNYTLAHELAHYFLDHKPNEYGVYRRDALYIEGKPSKEQEADCFAAELLMPKQLIKDVQKKYQLSDSDSVSLSKLFGVSPSAMKYRLRGLKHDRRAD